MLERLILKQFVQLLSVDHNALRFEDAVVVDKNPIYIYFVQIILYFGNLVISTSNFLMASKIYIRMF